jgi:hypothetical protein
VQAPWRAHHIPLVQHALGKPIDHLVQPISRPVHIRGVTKICTGRHLSLVSFAVRHLALAVTFVVRVVDQRVLLRFAQTFSHQPAITSWVGPLRPRIQSGPQMCNSDDLPNRARSFSRTLKSANILPYFLGTSPLELRIPHHRRLRSADPRPLPAVSLPQSAAWRRRTSVPPPTRSLRPTHPRNRQVRS